MNSRQVKPTCLDFFAGGGLASEGLKKWFDIVWANDICPKKAEVYIANHPKEAFNLGPIENVQGGVLQVADLSWASFPCQDLSLAGNKGGIRSRRSGLVWEWLRVMDEMGAPPPIAVAENVGGLISTAQGRNYIELHNALRDRGYKIGAVQLDASFWVPQSRKRIFVVAAKKEVPIQALTDNGPNWCHNIAIKKIGLSLKDWVWWKLPMPEKNNLTLDDICDVNAEFDDDVKQRHNLSLISESHWKNMQIGLNKERKVFPGYRRIRNGMQVLELRFDGIAGCLRTPQGGSSRQILVVRQNGSLHTRLLTIQETAILMGAPADYKIPGSYNDGYRAMGDAVVVPVVRYLAENILLPLSLEARSRALDGRKEAEKIRQG